MIIDFIKHILKYKDIQIRLQNYEKDILDYKSNMKTLEDSIKELKEKYENEQWKTLDLSNEYEDLMSVFISKYIEGIIKKNGEEKLYELLQPLDHEGWCELDAVQKLIPCNIYSEYYYEDTVGTFENMDGYDLIPYYEIAAFAENREYDFVGDMYEKLTSYDDYTNKAEYLQYCIKKQHDTLINISKKYPKEAIKIFNSL